MNLHTLDTTVGAGTISSRDGLCEFVKQVVEFNVKGQAYCCKDPFGKERYGNDPDLPRPCKVSYEKANITVVTLNLIVDADNPKYVESCVGEMRDDIKAALWYVADTLRREFSYKGRRSGQSAIVLDGDSGLRYSISGSFGHRTTITVMCLMRKSSGIPIVYACKKILRVEEDTPETLCSHPSIP